MSIRGAAFDPLDLCPAFQLDDNTFILNGRLTAPCEVSAPEEGAPDKRGRHARRLWAGFGLWAFVTLAIAVYAIPIGVGVMASKAKPALPIETQSAPPALPPFTGTAAAHPSPNVIADMQRWAQTVTLPSAPPLRHEISRSHAGRIISRHRFIASELEEPLPPASLGCPPSLGDSCR
jgi:hypothetical protein